MRNHKIKLHCLFVSVYKAFSIDILNSRMLFMIFHDATLELCVLVRHELVRGQVRVIGIVFDDVVATLGCKKKQSELA
jgi:hypothetical protein